VPPKDRLSRDRERSYDSAREDLAMTDATSGSWIEPERSDVLKRLADSQRALRQAMPPSGATMRVEPSVGLVDYGLLERAEALSVLDLTSHDPTPAYEPDEAPSPWVAPDEPRETPAASPWAATGDPRERAERLERSLEAIHRDLNEARRAAYDAIMALDDRFLELERAILAALGRGIE
jgi:hypothetical protein